MPYCWTFVQEGTCEGDYQDNYGTSAQGSQADMAHTV